MSDVVDQIRGMRDRVISGGCVKPGSLYSYVASAFRTPGATFLSDPLDFGALPDPSKWCPPGSWEEPPPRSGGGPYHALLWIYETCVEYPLMTRALEDIAATSGDLDSIWLILGCLEGSHLTRRECWYDASPHLLQWVFQLEHALFRDLESPIPRDQLTPLTEFRALHHRVDREAKKRRAQTFQTILKAAGIRHAHLARDFCDASLESGSRSGSSGIAWRRSVRRGRLPILWARSSRYTPSKCTGIMCARAPWPSSHRPITRYTIVLCGWPQRSWTRRRDGP